jgi:hypothetical protein
MKNCVRIVVGAALFFCRIAQAVSCGPTVQPISAGEGIWQITSRIGVTTDVIESLIGGLEDTCEIVIGQADIGSGGIYTFDGTGGTYGVTICLKEDVSFTTSAAITLRNTLLVTVDLTGHFIDGGNNPGTNAFLLKVFEDDLVIKNGTLMNVDFGALADVSVPFQGRNITFENVTFINTGTAVFMTDPVNLFIFGALRFENCRFLSAGDINVKSESTYFAHCSFFGDTNPGALILSDQSGNIGLRVLQDCGFVGTKGVQLINASFAYLQDCDFRNSLDTSISIPDASSVFMQGCAVKEQVAGDAIFIGLASATSTAVQLVNCVVQNCLGNGFVLSAPGLLFCNGCVAQECAGSGFVLTGTTTNNSETYFNNCSSVCNSAKGFDYRMCNSNGGTPNLIGLFFDTCIASGNAQEGFSINSSCATTNVKTGLFRKCTATDNGDDAFFFGGQIRDVLVYQCTANGNGGDGFDLGTTTTFIDMVYSCAQTNFGVGFRNNAALGANLCLGNTAVSNLGGNYGGVGGFDAVLVNSGEDEIAGGSNWTNASLPS